MRRRLLPRITAFIVTTVFTITTAMAVFPDVPPTHLNHDAITALKEQGILSGYPDGTFLPDKTVNRAEFLKVVIGALSPLEEILRTPPSNKLSDTPAGQWFSPYVWLAEQRSIIAGYPDRTFKPAQAINLVEALKIVTTAYQIPLPQYILPPLHWYDPYMDAANSHQLLTGVSSHSVSHIMTRGDVAQLISNVLAFKSPNTTTPEAPDVSEAEANTETATVLRVIDGDTIKVQYNGTEQSVRLIGVDTPETVHPTEPVACYGKEASAYTTAQLLGKTVTLETDPSQGTTDKYGRLLAYVYLNSVLFNKQLIQQGYAFEYTYNVPYAYRVDFEQAEDDARTNERGLWAPGVCTESGAISTPVDTEPTPSAEDSGCTIKGNINSSKEKIYHLESCPSYDVTVIDTTKGEQWFCSEAEATQAGWRIAGNC